jgi:type IV secretory pathway TrbD component
MAGTVLAVNQALSRPLLLAGCEKRLAMFNALLSFLLVAATYLHFPACLLGLGVYLLLHGLLVVLAKYDPLFSAVFQRATRYYGYPCFFAKSHVTTPMAWPVFSLPR